MAKRATPRPEARITGTRRKLADAGRERLTARLTARLERLAEFLAVPRRLERLGDVGELLRAKSTAATLRAHAPAIAAYQSAEILAMVDHYVEKRYRASVCERDELTNRWPLPFRDYAHGTLSEAAGVAVLETVRAWLSRKQTPPGDLEPAAFPADVPLLTATEWAQTKADGPFRQWLIDAAESLRAGIAVPFGGGVIVKTEDDVPDADAARYWSEWERCVVLYSGLEAVRRDSQRPFFAVDSSYAHSQLVDGLGAFVDRSPTREATLTVGRIELLAQGHAVQLELAFDESNSDKITTLIRECYGARAVRHYTALLVLLTTKGRRSGAVTWKVDDHLGALGVPSAEFRKYRDEAITAIKTFADLTVAIYDKDNRLRVRKPLLSVDGEIDINTPGPDGDHWATVGLRLRYTEELYAGVRHPNGTIGRNWYPAAPELATINEGSYPYAGLCGLRLGIRFRRAMNDGRTTLRLKGRNALELAAIRYRPKDPAHSWKSLTKTLDVLVPHSLSAWRWVEKPEHLDGLVELDAPHWAADRTLRSVPVSEPTPVDVPSTGAALKAWRESRGLGVEAAAALLGVDRTTIYRAEKATDKAIPKRLADQLRAARPAVR